MVSANDKGNTFRTSLEHCLLANKERHTVKQLEYARKTAQRDRLRAQLRDVEAASALVKDIRADHSAASVTTPRRKKAAMPHKSLSQPKPLVCVK